MENKELLNYIKQQLEQGVTKEDIKNSLLSQGQQGQDIEMVFRSVESSLQLPKKKKSWKVTIVILSIVVLLVIVAFFVNKSLTPSAKDIPPINDSDLSLKTITIPDNDNAYFDLIKFKSVIYAPRDKASIISSMAYGKTWDEKLAEEIISKNIQAFNYFIDAVKKPAFQDPVFANPANITPNAILPPLNSWRTISRLSNIKAFYLEKQGKDKEALNEALLPVVMGQKIQNSQINMIEYLVSMAMKKMGLETMQKIISSSTLSSRELLPYIKILNKFYKNESGLVSAFKAEYKMSSVGIDLTAKSSGKDINMLLGDFESKGTTKSEVTTKMIRNSYYFQPNATKALFAGHWRKSIKMTEGPCSNVKKEKIQNTVPHSKEEFNKTENAIGKTFYSIMSAGLSPVIIKKCEESILIGATQTMIAVKAFYEDTGKYPATLEDLVPKYLSSVPKDPFDGKQLKYSKDKKIIYSIGKDMKDEGGSTGDNWQNMPDPTFKIGF